jgi:hypothetical protein
MDAKTWITEASAFLGGLWIVLNGLGVVIPEDISIGVGIIVAVVLRVLVKKGWLK